MKYGKFLRKIYLVIPILIILTIFFSSKIFISKNYEIILYKTENSPENVLTYPTRGIISDGFWQDFLFLNVTFEDPTKPLYFGIFIKENEEYFPLITEEQEKALKTDFGNYPRTSTLFYKLEKKFTRDSEKLIKEMLNHKDKIYFCVLFDQNSNINDQSCLPISLQKIS